MEHIKQLKAIRDSALTRLQSNSDYKLLTSLDNLIVELEGVAAMAELAEKSVASSLTSKENDKSTQTLDKAFEKITTPKATNGSGTSSGSSVVDLSDEINGGVSAN